jgi:fucose permease
VAEESSPVELVKPVTSETSPTSVSAGTEVSFQPVALAGVTGAFVLIGAISSMFGPLLESFTSRFHVSLPGAGLALSIYFVGASIGALPGWLGLKRLSGRVVLTLSLIAVALGAAGSTLSHRWVLFLGGIFIIGLGFGTLEIALNTLLARTAIRGRARRLSVGNAGYGVGAVLCPLVVIAILPNHFPALFIGLAVVALLLISTNAGVHAPALHSEPLQAAISKMPGRRAILFTFVLAFIVYVALETSASGWMATELHRVGYSENLGSVVTAGFWTGMTVGRSFGGPLDRWLSATTLVLGGLALAILVSMVASFNAIAPFAYPLLGLILASVFPMGLIWYTTLCPHDSDGLSLLIVLLMIGGAAGPALVSLLVSHFGVHAVPVALASFAAIDLALFASARRFRPLVLTGIG